MLETAASRTVIVGGANASRVFLFHFPEFQILRTIVRPIAVLVVYPLMFFK